jgi:opacity protein-like surface antigen
MLKVINKEKYMITKMLPLMLLVLTFSSAALAQSDEYRKWEFYGGYSAMHFDNLGNDTNIQSLSEVLNEKQTLRGFNLAINHNFHKYFGVKFDYSLHLREDNFTRPAGSGTVDTTVQNYLGGIQIKDNRKDGPRFRPFAHALFGVANQKVDVDSPQLPAVFGISDFHVNESSFAMAFGGGLDIIINKHFSARVIQLDWNIINRGDQQTGIILTATPTQPVGSRLVIPGRRQDNLRIGAGIVIH